MSETATTDAKPGLFKALAQFQASLPKVVKDNTGKVEGKDGKKGYQYKYADLADVSEVALPLLGKFGLSFFSRPTVREDGKFGLAYTLAHVSGEREDGFYPLRSDLDPQKTGGLITYARRYSLCAATGIAPAGDDDDAQSLQGTSMQSAADAFDSASPARPPQGAQPRPAQPRQLRPAAASTPPPAGSSKWLEGALKVAPALGTLAACRTLWTTATAKASAGEIGKADDVRVKDLLRPRMGELKRAGNGDGELVPDDPWALKAEETASPEDALSVLDELGRMIGAGEIEPGHADRVEAAILAKFPEASLADGKADAA